MALSIGVSVGSKIDIGGKMLTVKAMAPPNLIVVSVDGAADVVVSDLSRTEILPNVFVFAGVGKGGGSHRLAFEASRSIRISRVEEGWVR